MDHAILALGAFDGPAIMLATGEVVAKGAVDDRKTASITSIVKRFTNLAKVMSRDPTLFSSSFCKGGVERTWRETRKACLNVQEQINNVKMAGVRLRRALMKHKKAVERTPACLGLVKIIKLSNYNKLIKALHLAEAFLDNQDIPKIPRRKYTTFVDISLLLDSQGFPENPLRDELAKFIEQDEGIALSVEGVIRKKGEISKFNEHIINFLVKKYGFAYRVCEEKYLLRVTRDDELISYESFLSFINTIEAADLIDTDEKADSFLKGHSFDMYLSPEIYKDLKKALICHHFCLDSTSPQDSELNKTLFAKAIYFYFNENYFPKGEFNTIFINPKIFAEFLSSLVHPHRPIYESIPISDDRADKLLYNIGFRQTLHVAITSFKAYLKITPISLKHYSHLSTPSDHKIFNQACCMFLQSQAKEVDSDDMTKIFLEYANSSELMNQDIFNHYYKIFTAPSPRLQERFQIWIRSLAPRPKISQALVEPLRCNMKSFLALPALNPTEEFEDFSDSEQDSPTSD